MRTIEAKPRVVIIGAGAVGAMCAWLLQAAGFAVAVLEKAHPGNGSSSRAAGAYRVQFEHPSVIAGMAYAINFFRHNLPNGFLNPCGYLFLHNSFPEWEKAQAMVTLHQPWGIPTQLLKPGDAGFEPWPYLDQTNILGATYNPADGLLQQDMLYQVALQKAKDLGAIVVQQCKVVGVRRKGERITHVIARKDGKRQYHAADWVVNATNAWANQVQKVLQGQALPIDVQRVHLYTLENLGLSPKQLAQLPMVPCMGSGQGTYIHREGQGVLIGGIHRVEPMPVNFNDDDQDGYGQEFGRLEYGMELLELLMPFMPSVFVDKTHFTGHTRGLYAMTPDHRPLIGFDSLISNLVVAAGGSGHGVMFSPAAALMVCQLLKGVTGTFALSDPPFNINLADFALTREFGGKDLQI